MASGPKPHKSPLELLNDDRPREIPLLARHWGPVSIGTLMFLGVCTANYGTKRPLLAGIQRHVLLTGAGIVIGKLIEDWRAGYVAERDAVFRHYIELHPDDFPPYDRKTFGEVLEPWVPIR